MPITSVPQPRKMPPHKNGMTSQDAPSLASLHLKASISPAGRKEFFNLPSCDSSILFPNFAVDFRRTIGATMDVHARCIGILLAQHLSLYVIPTAVAFVTGQCADAVHVVKVNDVRLQAAQHP